jgi:deoxyribose-phosphate aldolase
MGKRSTKKSGQTKAQYGILRNMEPINRYLDAAVLKPELTQAEAIAAIQESIRWKTKTVCVRPCDIEIAKKLTAGTDTGVSCVLAFPHGSTTTAVKAFEAAEYIALGVDEIDMVANYGLIRSGRWDDVKADIRAVADICRKASVPLKVILETCYLSNDEIERTTEICVGVKAAYVKTSTGFATGGATVEAVKVMLDAAKGRIKVKASGGIRDRETALAYVRMGADRLGTNYTASEALVTGGKNAVQGTACSSGAAAY